MHLNLNPGLWEGRTSMLLLLLSVFVPSVGTPPSGVLQRATNSGRTVAVSPLNRPDHTHILRSGVC